MLYVYTISYTNVKNYSLFIDVLGFSWSTREFDLMALNNPSDTAGLVRSF